jgi:hypothetical protein
MDSRVTRKIAGQASSSGEGDVKMSVCAGWFEWNLEMIKPEDASIFD